MNARHPFSFSCDDWICLLDANRRHKKPITNLDKTNFGVKFIPDMTFYKSPVYWNFPPQYKPNNLGPNIFHVTLKYVSKSQQGL